MAEPWFFEVLPCRPPPEAGECLSGYLLRLAETNGYLIFWDLVSELFPKWKHPSQIAQLRWEYPLENWGRIPLVTQLSLSVLTRLTVQPWLEKFQWQPPTSVKGQGPGQYLREVVRAEMHLCPLCLQAHPVLRLLWRLTPVCVCLEHGCLLQNRCVQCDHPLALWGEGQRYLHCGHCGADVRQFPVTRATPDLLRRQESQQTALQFLLDPALPLASGAEGGLRQALGLKYRYLRSQTGRSVVEMARQVGCADGTLSSLELGNPVPLLTYLTYLEALGVSWASFAALEVPPTFLAQLQSPPHLSLRLCPNPACSLYLAPPSLRVCISADLPARQIVRFRCTACHRTFTRAYDGQLRSKARRPPLQPGEPPPVVKPADEIARLIEMGLRGEDNRQIARHLGWGEKTVRMYWIALNLEARVHKAQAQRRVAEQQAREMVLQVRMEAALAHLLDEEEEITLRHLARALGFNPDYFQSRPRLAQQATAVLQTHNTQVRQRRALVVNRQITQALEALPHTNTQMNMTTLAQQAGLSLSQFRDGYPALYTHAQPVLRAHRARLKEVHIQQQLAQIHAAAARLVAQTIPLTYQKLLKEAGLTTSSNSVPLLRNALEHWIGNFAPLD